MDNEIKIIKRLLMIRREYPFLAISVKSQGLIYEFYLKKGFWNQIYGKYIVEVFSYKGLSPLCDYSNLVIKKQLGVVNSLDLFSSEEESQCENEIQKFCLGLIKNGGVEIIQNNINP